MVQSWHLCSKTEKKFSNVTSPVISDFENADRGGQNEFQTKAVNLDAGFFLNPAVGIWPGVIMWTFFKTKHRILKILNTDYIQN